MIKIICTNFGNSKIYIKPGRQSERNTAIHKNLATSGQKFQKILFMASSCTYYEPNCGSTSLWDQNCGVQPADRQTDRITHTGTDKSLKTEGPKILSNDTI